MRCFEGLGRFEVRGEFLRWFPPYSIKGLWEPGGSGLQSSLRSDLANTPQHWHLCFFECFCWVGTIWGQGGIPKVVPPLLVRGTLEAGGRQFPFASGISSDMVFIDQTCFWADFLRGYGDLGQEGNS